MLFCWDFKTLQYIAAVLPLLPAFPLSAAEPPDQPPPFNSPITAEESLKHFQLHPNLKIELVAAEPEVVDPVAIRFDEAGRLWVVEMIDYPNGPEPGQPPMSRIRVLRDKNGDGRYETSTVFADNLLFVTGLQPWRGGVIVTLAGKVAYMKDTNGDGSADIHETWFTGFAEKNPQLRANHPTFALDNRIYIANGLRGGDVIAHRDQWSANAKALSISGMDFRFDPRSGQYEAVTGNGQFGLTFDDFGNRFVCSNRNPCKHVVLEDRYIKRNPHLAVRSTTHDVSPAGEDSRVFPISRTWTTSTLHQGQFTAACGVTIYRGDALPAEFRGNSFTCEPTGNLVHRDVLSPQGATFTSQPGREGVEFLATRDEWFRPVNLAGGPDGALYVVDMYRAVIEHPQWVPDELKNRPDERYGDDRGRIYRIVPRQPSQTGGRRRSLGSWEAQGFGTFHLVDLLNHPNAWHRETAARLIYERQNASLQPHLESLARTASTPQGRIHALWALHGLNRLSPDQIQTALADENPRVAEHAVRLAEPFLTENQSLRAKLRKLAAHPDPRLRFQVALSLGESPDTTDAQTVAALADIALQSPGDPWTRNAVLSSLSDNPLPLLEITMKETGSESKPPAPSIADLIEATAEVIGSRRNETELKAALKTLCPPENDAHADLRARMAGLDGLGSGLARRGQSLRTVIAKLPDDDRQAVEEVFQIAIEIARSPEAIDAQRIQALQTLTHAEYNLAGEPLLQLAADGTNRAVQAAAIETLAAFDATEIGPALLADFAAQTPALRRAVLDALLADENRTRLLLEEIAAGKIAASELDPGRTARLNRHRNSEIRKRAKELLAAAVPEDRKQVLEKYQPALSLKADPAQGRLVFEKHCAACHRIGTLGVNVAPDIADSRNKTPSYLLTAILDPNRAVDSNYFSYTVVTTQGKVHTGVISAETATSVTLRQQENKTVTLLREDIDEIRSTGVSLMPVGLEKNIPPQQMADLISFIKNWRYLDGRVPIELGRE